MIRSKGTDEAASKWPLGTSDQMHYRTRANFRLRLLTGLPTRNFMIIRKQGMIKKAKEMNNEKKAIRLKNKYNDDTCINCENNNKMRI